MVLQLSEDGRDLGPVGYCTVCKVLCQVGKGWFRLSTRRTCQFQAPVNLVGASMCSGEPGAQSPGG